MEAAATGTVCRDLDPVTWELLPSHFAPGANGAIILIADVDDFSEEHFEQFVSQLTEAESERAASYLSWLHRKQYILSHFLLRKVIGQILGKNPLDILFIEAEKKKPALAGANQSLSFNLSHAGGKILIGLNFDGEIGVDIEKEDPGFDYTAFAKEHFSDGEKRMLDQAGNDKAVKIFFKIWTRKEAWLKLTGEGLRDDLFAVDVSDDKTGAEENTLICSLELEDYAISIATTGNPALRFYKITEA